VSEVQDQIDRIVAEGEGLLVSSFIWLEDVRRLVAQARDGDAHARFSLELFAQAVERDATRGALKCLFCARSTRLTHCSMIGALHSPRGATGAVLFVVCEDCGVEDRDAMVARGREAIIGLFEGGIRPLQIHEDVGHA
jgi:hypothetical protein